MRYAIAILVLALSASQAAANCPIGSHPWTDNWGNQICKRFSDGGTSTIQGNSFNAGGCPIGSYPWTDNWGNRICKTFDTPMAPQQQYYDTSRGCPVGTFQWVDNWGNKICKRF